MEKINFLVFLLGMILCTEGYPAKAIEIHHAKPPIIQLIGAEKGTSAQGITIQTQAATDKVIFHFDLKKWGKGTLRVSDTWGKLLLEKEIKDWSIGINLHNAAPGIYSITLEKEHLFEVVEIRKE
jgi:hypothetical protein